MMMRKLTRAAAACALVAALATPAFAQDAEYRAQLQTQLEAARSMFQGENMDVAAGPFFGSLAEGAKETYTLRVQRGETYHILGVCDNDCSDLDIRLLNSSGEVIGEDQLEDDVPIVELVPTITGTVRIEVEMYKCSAEPCFFAVEAYQK